MNGSQLKHNQIFERLLSELSNTRLQIGSRLPPERELAKKLNVNIATIRRAFRDLVLAGIVEKHVGAGTYLRQMPLALWQNRIIHLLVNSFHTTEFDRELWRQFHSVLRQKGRTGRVVGVNEENLENVIQSCIRLQQPAIVAADGSEEMLMRCPQLFVRLSSMAYRSGIPSVLCDDVEGMNLQIRHLRNIGCRRIALLAAQGFWDVQDMQIAAWRGALQENDTRELLIVAGRNERSTADNSFDAMSAALKRTTMDGLICLTDELMFGALSAICRNGIRIPEEIAVVSIGDTELARLSNPPVTGVNPNAAEHIQAAIELLDYNHEHKQELDLMRLIKPTLHVRQSSLRKQVRLNSEL